MLPEAAHLEMARTAVKMAADADARAEVRLEQVEWLRPVVVGAEGFELLVELFADEDGKAGYEIYSADGDGARVIHSQGWAAVETVGASPEASVEVSGASAGTMLVQRVWQPRAPEADAASGHGQHWIVLCGGEAWAREMEGEVRAALPQARCVVVESRGEDGLAQRYEAGVLQASRAAAADCAGQAEGRGPDPGRDAVGRETTRCLLGLPGCLKTARLEHPKLKGQVVRCEVQATAAQIVEQLRESARAPDEREIRYCDGERQVAPGMSCRRQVRLREVPWRDGGVYLITGGAGGLGLVFAEEIVRRAKNAVVVLTGRSELDAGKRAQLSALEGRGSRIEYRRVDVGDAAAVSGADRLSCGRPMAG